MSHTVTIEQVDNGFVVKRDTSYRVYTSLDDLFSDLLQYFEGVSPMFSGDMFGAVKIYRGEQVAQTGDTTA